MTVMPSIERDPDSRAEENLIYMSEITRDGENHMLKEKLYPPTLERQVRRFIDDKKEINAKKPEHARRDERNYAYLEDFFEKLFTERNIRTYEVESEEYQAVRKLANQQFPVRPYWNLCMDGRVLSVLTNGASSGIGTSTRVPGAMHREFVRGENGQTFLREHSTFAELLDSGLKKSPTGAIAEIFDSHIHCAAREAEENQAGKHPHDHGLMADVLSKKEMAQATEKYVERKHGENKRVIPIQTSFDPSSGFMYMGLETDSAMALARGFAHAQADRAGISKDKIKPEFTAEVLQHLVQDGGIISTADMVKDEQIKQVFDQYGNFTIDWQHNYVESAQKFWQGIDNMREVLLPRIENAVRSLYPTADDIETEERAVLLLTNAFSGYLHNKRSHEDADTSDNGTYGYGLHKEQFIKIYEGGQPPYDISAFVLNPDLKDLPANIELAASLVRKNRLDGRVTDASGNFADNEEFREAVVPIVVQEIVREPLKEDEWQELAEIDWYDENHPFPKNWDRMTDNEFNDFLLEKGVHNLGVAKGINNLRRRMSILYDPDLPTANRINEQYKVALPTISGKNRRNYFIVPFTKQGFIEE